MQSGVDELHRAARIADDLGMPALRRRLAEVMGNQGKVSIPGDVPTTAAGRSGSLVREGDVWAMTFESRAFRTRASKGLAYIAVLLADPGREIAAIDLVTGSPRTGRRLEHDERGHVSSVHDPIIDAHARSAYRERLIDLEDEIAEAVSVGDEGRAASLRTESDFLARELASAVGLLGRSRTHAHPAERARQSATKAIRSALTRIDRYDPALGDHLQHAIRTGVMCSYAPDPHAAVLWNIVDGSPLRSRPRVRSAPPPEPRRRYSGAV